VAFVLSGAPPFEGNDAAAILAQQLARQFDARRYPEPIAEWLTRGLAVDVESRFQDAGVMQASWREVIEEMERRARRSERWWDLLGRR
jgi:hypothetical protein